MHQVTITHASLRYVKTFFWKYSHDTVVRGAVDPYGDDDAIICTSRPEMSNVSTVNKQEVRAYRIRT